MPRAHAAQALLPEWTGPRGSPSAVVAAAQFLDFFQKEEAGLALIGPALSYAASLAASGTAGGADAAYIANRLRPLAAEILSQRPATVEEEARLHERLAALRHLAGFLAPAQRAAVNDRYEGIADKRRERLTAEIEKAVAGWGRPGGLLTDEQLNLTPAHYEQARRIYGGLFSLRPAGPVEPVLADSGEKTHFQVGDEVKIGLSTFDYSRFIEGTVERLILEGKALVGLVVQRPADSGPGSATYRQTPPPDLVWLNDVDPSQATIVKRGSAARPQAVQASEVPEPESSFPIFFEYGKRQMAPIAPGDRVTLYFKEKNGQRIILGHERVEQLVRDANGNPVGLRFKYPYDYRRSDWGAHHYDPARVAEDGLVTVYFREILRLVFCRLETSMPIFFQFHFPRSRWRASGQPNAYAWLPALGAALWAPADSGEFTLRLRRGTQPLDEQAPVSVGDELLLSIKDPTNEARGAYFKRAVVLEILKDEAGKTYGFRTESDKTEEFGDPTTIARLEDFDRDDSFIETEPRSTRAHALPGAWGKRGPYVPHIAEGHHEYYDEEKAREFWERIFGSPEEFVRRLLHGIGWAAGFNEDEAASKFDYDPATLTPWEGAPIPFDQWLERFSIARHPIAQVLWARWVLRVDESASKDEIIRSYRSLFKRFHADWKLQRGDGGAQSHAASLIGEAKGILLPKRR